MGRYALTTKTGWHIPPTREHSPLAGFLDNLTGFVSTAAPIYSDIKAKERAYELQIKQLKQQQKLAKQQHEAQFQPGGHHQLDAGGTTAPGLRGWWVNNRQWAVPSMWAVTGLMVLWIMNSRRSIRRYRRNPSPVRRRITPRKPAKRRVAVKKRATTAKRNPTRRKPVKRKAVKRRQPVRRKALRRKVVKRRQPVRRKAPRRKVVKRRRR